MARRSGQREIQTRAMAESAACALCERRVARVTEHHLTPRSEGGRETAAFCSACHRQVHALYENRTLAAKLDSIARLRAAPEMRRYLPWIRKQADRHVRVRRSRSRR